VVRQILLCHAIVVIGVLVVDVVANNADVNVNVHFTFIKTMLLLLQLPNTDNIVLVVFVADHIARVV
jgi:hypothetical protein